MRLIDADALIERKFILHDMEELTHEEFEKLVNEQPTAYVLESVVAELEKEQKKDIQDAKFYRDTKNEKLCIAYTSKARAYKDAIEIVRKGGAT